VNPRARRLAGLLLLALPGVAVAQVRPEPPRRPPAVRDSATADTAVTWLPPDSVMRALLEKPGYTVTRYEGETVTFDALVKSFAIAADSTRRAQVEREGQRVVTDSVIVYDDRTRRVNVSGRFEIVPGGGQAPIAGIGTAQYDLAERSGRGTNASVTAPDESGQQWYIRSEIYKTALGDSTRGIPPRFYGLGGTLTSCDDSIPDYHFRLREIKRTERTLVARPAVLYIRDIPVMWLPFVFQDIRPGRRSGILPPRFGASDIVRNNPGYRRHVENVGFYWALSDYMDATAWADWRSGAGADSLDPGWYRVNGEWKYKWLSRFLDGRLASSYTRQRNGQENLAVSWGHQQKLGPNRNFRIDGNYVTSTQLQRQNTFNPLQSIATIRSSFSYSDKIGPASLQLGGNRTQYPGRPTVEQTLPMLSLTTGSINIAPWLVWTPSFRFEERATLKNDRPGQFSSRYISDGSGNLLRVDTLKQNSYNRTLAFDTPLRIFGFDLRNGVAITDRLEDYPIEQSYYVDADSTRKETRVFLSSYRTDVDWNPTFSLPPFFQNRFKLTPSVSLSNVESGPFWVRTELTGGRFVHQSKRLSYGLSAAPTIFGIWPGFGPFQRFRHAVNPVVSYSYAPRAAVSNAYLAALGRRRERFSSLQQSSISLSLSQNIEAKVRSSRDTGDTAEGQKLKVLSLGFSPFSYDFERAREVGRKLAGLTTENLTSTITSDLLPGFNLSIQHSLFRGSTQSDTAEFDPFLTQVSSSFRISQGDNPFTVITRLFGQAVPDRSPDPRIGTTDPGEGALARQIASQPVAGQAARGAQFVVPPTRGWEASVNFSTSRSRRPRGGNFIEVDPRTRCEQFRLVNPFAYDECLRAPINDAVVPGTTAGAPVFITPPQTSLGGDMRFELTQKWAAAWNTSYDFERSQFAQHVVSLQRDLHDWRASFNFTHSPNGNFAFSFFIALKPQPDLKFDYSRATVRGR
jgi:hypothetical protein